MNKKMLARRNQRTVFSENILLSSYKSIYLLLKNKGNAQHSSLLYSYNLLKIKPID